MSTSDDTVDGLERALAIADPFSTELATEDRLGEYSMEAELVAKKLAAGEPLKPSVDHAFRELAEVELSKETLARICNEFDEQSGPT